MTINIHNKNYIVCYTSTSRTVVQLALWMAAGVCGHPQVVENYIKQEVAYLILWLPRLRRGISSFPLHRFDQTETHSSSQCDKFLKTNF